MKKLAALFLAVVMCATCLAACGEKPTGESTPPASDPGVSAGVEQPAGEKAVVVGIPSTWNTMVPMNPGSAYTLEVGGLLFDTLIRINTNGQGEPRAAESWEMSEDLTTITLHLRKDSYWHDGEQVTSADWRYMIELMTSAAGSACVTQDKFAIVTGTEPGGKLAEGETLGIETPDDFTLVVHLKEAMNADTFFFNWSKMWFALPEHILKDKDPAELVNWDFWQNPVGSGPFTFVSESSGTELVMKAFDNYYYDIDFDTLIYRVVTTDAALSSLMAGELDIYYYSWTPDDLLTVEGNESLHVEELVGATSLHFLSLSNVVFDAAARQAINLAIDKQMILNAVYGGAGVASNTSVRPSSEYCAESWTGRDVEKAKELLAQSGLDTGKTLTLATSAGRGEDVAAIIQQNLAEIGLTVDIATGDTSSVLAGARDGTYDMCLKNNSSGGSPTWLVASDLSLNAKTVSRISDAKYDEYASQINQATDPTEIKALSEQFQQYCDEQMPLSVLCHTYEYYVLSSRVSNVSVVETTAPWEWVVTG